MDKKVFQNSQSIRNIDGVIDLLPMPLVSHKPVGFERSQMLGDGRLLEADTSDDLPHGPLSAHQHLQNLVTVPVADTFAEILDFLAEFVHIKILAYPYILSNKAPQPEGWCIPGASLASAEYVAAPAFAGSLRLPDLCYSLR